MRYESPVQTFFRTTTRPVDIAGIAVGEGEKVLMFLGAANHDRRRWERPDEYDITRRTTGHVGRRGGPVISGPSRKAAMLSLFPGPLHEPRRERSVDARLEQREFDAHLGRADLSGADLSEAILSGAILDNANLRRTHLAGAHLRGTNLTGANLSGANLREALLFKTVFGDVDLSETVGLDKCNHYGPSIIDFQTLSRSGNLPISFMRGCRLLECAAVFEIGRDPLPGNCSCRAWLRQW